MTTTLSGNGTTTTIGSAGENNEPTPETTMELTGNIPLNLDGNFYFYIESKTVAGVVNQSFYSFTAMKIGEAGEECIYTKYSYHKYDSNDDLLTDTYTKSFTEERLLYDGVNYRKSTYDNVEGSGDYAENWNSTVPTSTIQYIQNFLNGDHVADTPYGSNTKISSNLSQYIHNKNANTDVAIATMDIYKDGTESYTFDKYESNDASYTPEQTYQATVTKYYGLQKNGNDQPVMDVKVWGNIIVYAAPLQGRTVCNKTITSKYSNTLSQETWEKVQAEIGFTEPIV